MAFSGGVDSTLLLYAAREAIGEERVFVLRGVSELLAQREIDDAVRVLDELGVELQQRFEVNHYPLVHPGFVANAPDRCYFCKKIMYQAFLDLLKNNDCTILLDGSNVDDLQSSRPGFRAIHELGVCTPLLDGGLNKEDIRALAKMFKLSNHDKPSNSCLATRLAEGIHIEREELKLVEQFEEFLLDYECLGCRVKINRKSVILQVAARDIERFVVSSRRVEVLHFFQSEGFEEVLLDIKARE